MGVSRSDLVRLARKLRCRMTVPERLVWARIRRGRLYGIKFRRQQPSLQYIVDFLAPAPRLIIEIDGRTHEGAEAYRRDVKRQAELESAGYTVLRFDNDEVLADPDAVVEQITFWLEDHGYAKDI